MSEDASPTPGVVSVSRVIAAPPERIFAILADPSMHPLIDGSGTVRKARPDAPSRLTLGARFGMDMKRGLPYRMSNTVVEFEDDRRIAWRHYGGHVWRYELEPVEGGTKVTESFDATTSRAPWLLKLMKAAEKNEVAMEQTLERLAAQVS